MSYLLGIDVGTTSIKYVLFDEKGKVVALSKSEYNLLCRNLTS
jgi:sugar (pentulose or hexulose) kinase